MLLSAPDYQVIIVLTSCRVASSNQELLTLGSQKKKRRRESYNDRREESRNSNSKTFSCIYYLRVDHTCAVKTSRGKIYLVLLEQRVNGMSEFFLSGSVFLFVLSLCHWSVISQVYTHFSKICQNAITLHLTLRAREGQDVVGTGKGKVPLRLAFRARERGRGVVVVAGMAWGGI
jgi:hypothetical protein